MRRNRAADAAHIAEIGLSWTDDSVTLMCRRDECIIDGYWWQRELPYMCTPEVAAEYRDKHLRGEDW